MFDHNELQVIWRCFSSVIDGAFHPKLLYSRDSPISFWNGRNEIFPLFFRTGANEFLPCIHRSKSVSIVLDRSHPCSSMIHCYISFLPT